MPLSAALQKNKNASVKLLRTQASGYYSQISKTNEVYSSVFEKSFYTGFAAIIWRNPHLYEFSNTHLLEHRVRIMPYGNNILGRVHTIEMALVISLILCGLRKVFEGIAGSYVEKIRRKVRLESAINNAIGLV